LSEAFLVEELPDDEEFDEFAELYTLAIMFYGISNVPVNTGLSEEILDAICKLF